MKYEVSWWIHGAGHIVRGKDEIDGEDLVDEDVEEFIQDDLAKREHGITFHANLPNFTKTHLDLTMQSHHSEVSNWGILNVKILGEGKTEKEKEG